MVSIVIPVFNEIEMTVDCFAAIRANTEDFEVVFVDNGSVPRLAWSDIPDSRVSFIRNEENLGFPTAVNQGIKAATGDTIVILNNDVIVTPGWMETLQGRLSDGLAMVGPVTNQISGPQQVLIDSYDDLTALYKASEDHKKKNEGQWFPFHRLVFY